MQQLTILLTGAVAIVLVQFDSVAIRQWACIVGMIGQPFWFLATYRAKQWGMFAVTVIYTAAWMGGLWKFWIKPLFNLVPVWVVA